MLGGVSQIDTFDPKPALAGLPSYNRGNVNTLAWKLPLDGFKSKNWWGDGTAAAKLIAPRLRQDWLVHSEFSHAPHQAVVCKDCHAAAESSRSQDLLLPPIATCRTCHTGADDSHGIPSKCIDCHRFHRDQGMPMGAAAEVKPLASPVEPYPAEPAAAPAAVEPGS